jgi:excisionase family DNA binding protein
MENEKIIQIKSPLLDHTQAATYLNISPGTLYNMRSRGEGPGVTRIGRAIRYHIRDLDKYIAQNFQRTAESQ